MAVPDGSDDPTVSISQSHALSIPKGMPRSCIRRSRFVNCLLLASAVKHLPTRHPRRDFPTLPRRQHGSPGPGVRRLPHHRRGPAAQGASPPFPRPVADRPGVRRLPAAARMAHRPAAVGRAARPLLPDPAVRHRRPARGRRHRAQPHEPVDARRLRPGTLRIPQGALPRRRAAPRRPRLRCPPFEDQRKQYNPDLPNPVLHLSSQDLAQHAAGVYAANGIHAHILPPDSPRYLATPELSFTIRQLQAPRRAEHLGLAQSARRQRRQVLRRARRPAGAARRSDHGRPGRSGRRTSRRCPGPRRSAPAASTSSTRRRTRPTSTCAASRAWCRRRARTRSRSSSRRCTASAP